MTFVKAQRKRVKLRIGVSGPSGSGKTLSSLYIANGIGKKIVLIDTENGSGSLYADKVDFDYDTAEITPPFSPEKYVQVIEQAEKAGYDVIIIDSFTHAWAGEGGTLDKKAVLDARGGNQYANWKAPKQDFTKLKNAILHSSAHIICTLRSKQAYEMVDDNGKKKPQKMGLDPISEPGIEYEFTVVFDMAMNHTALASKDRTDLFKDHAFVPKKETGEMILKWLDGGAEPTKPKSSAKPQVVSHSNGNGSDIPLCKTCETLMMISKSGKHYYCPNWNDEGKHNPIKITKRPKDAEDELFGEGPPPELDESEPMPSFKDFK